MDMYVQ